MSIEKKEERIMASIPIASSFKGILRIAHIQELNGNDTTSDDNFFNKTYYNKDWDSEFNLMNISGSSKTKTNYGYSKASSGFEGKITRYNSSDKYVDKKLPVTDSVGNFLNFYVGPDGSLFGSEESNAGNSLEKIEYNDEKYSKLYPNLSAKKIDVGIEYKRTGITDSSIFTFSGQLNVDKNLIKKSSEIIFNNKFDHTFADSFDNVQPTGANSEEATRANYKINTNRNLRTIFSFSNETPKEYDVLMHHQENFDEENYKLDNKNVDSYVDIVNLKDYIKERIDKYKSEMTVELPPGSVIWQYVDLNKWYCKSSSGYDEGSGEDSLKYCGHRPAMVSTKDVKTYPSIMSNRDTTITNAGVACKDVSKLVLPTSVVEVVEKEDESKNTIKTTKINISTAKEIIPTYKRNFLLCDGSKFTIKTKMSSNDYYDILSFERLIDLFYVIGYEYTESATIGKMRNVTKNSNNSYAEATITWTSFASDLGNFWKDALYERSMACILAYKKIRNDIKSGGKHTFENGSYDKDTAKSWLEGEEIPEEYAFNTMYYGGVNSDEINYSYNGVTLKLGKEVKTFSDEIAYPYRGNPKNRARIIDTFEINKILEYFGKDDAGMISEENNYPDVFSHTFQVPNFFDSNKNMGVFIGSSAAESIFGNGGIFTSTSFIDDEHIAHRHGLYASGSGDKILKDNPDCYPVLYKNHGNYDYFSLGTPSSSSLSNVPEVPSYYIQEIDKNNFSTIKYETNPNTGVKTLVNGSSTFSVKEYSDTYTSDSKSIFEVTIDKNYDPRQITMEPDRGITSPPISTSTSTIDFKRDWVKKNLGISSVDKIFSPECVQMLPLISL